MNQDRKNQFSYNDAQRQEIIQKMTSTALQPNKDDKIYAVQQIDKQIDSLQKFYYSQKQSNEIHCHRFALEIIEEQQKQMKILQCTSFSDIHLIEMQAATNDEFIVKLDNNQLIMINGTELKRYLFNFSVDEIMQHLMRKQSNTVIDEAQNTNQTAQIYDLDKLENEILENRTQVRQLTQQIVALTQNIKQSPQIQSLKRTPTSNQRYALLKLPNALSNESMKSVARSDAMESLRQNQIQAFLKPRKQAFFHFTPLKQILYEQNDELYVPIMQRFQLNTQLKQNKPLSEQRRKRDNLLRNEQIEQQEVKVVLNEDLPLLEQKRSLCEAVTSQVDYLHKIVDNIQNCNSEDEIRKLIENANQKFTQFQSELSQNVDKEPIAEKFELQQKIHESAQEKVKKELPTKYIKPHRKFRSNVLIAKAANESKKRDMNQAEQCSTQSIQQQKVELKTPEKQQIDETQENIQQNIETTNFGFDEKTEIKENQQIQEDNQKYNGEKTHIDEFDVQTEPNVQQEELQHIKNDEPQDQPNNDEQQQIQLEEDAVDVEIQYEHQNLEQQENDNEKEMIEQNKIPDEPIEQEPIVADNNEVAITDLNQEVENPTQDVIAEQQNEDNLVVEDIAQDTHEEANQENKQQEQQQEDNQVPNEEILKLPVDEEEMQDKSAQLHDYQAVVEEQQLDEMQNVDENQKNATPQEQLNIEPQQTDNIESIRLNYETETPQELKDEPITAEYEIATSVQLIEEENKPIETQAQDKQASQADFDESIAEPPQIEVEQPQQGKEPLQVEETEIKTTFYDQFENKPGDQQIEQVMEDNKEQAVEIHTSIEKEVKLLNQYENAEQTVKIADIEVFDKGFEVENNKIGGNSAFDW